MGKAKKRFEDAVAVKDAEVKNLELAQQISLRRLKQAEEMMNEFLANPLAGTSKEANDTRIKDLINQLEQEKLTRQALAIGWTTQITNKNKQIQELEEQVKALRKEVEKKDTELQAKVLVQPEQPPALAPSYFEHLEADIPTSSFDAAGPYEEPDYTVAGYTTANPRETDLEKELREQIQREVDELVKECMQWEARVIHSACIVYLKPEAIHTDYHMPTLPYPLLKQEVQLMKKTFLPECQPNELGGYAQVPIQDYQVMDIEKKQPRWRQTWMKKNVRNRLHYLAAPQELRIDPTFFPLKRQRNWDTFHRLTKSTDRMTWLTYPELPEPKQRRMPIEKYMLETLNGVID